MAETLYFYDLETTGFSPRDSRITQFAGQRTTLDLKPLGDPHNLLIKVSEDILPDPGAVLLTGITPQMTVTDCYTEAEFLKIFYKEISVPGTIFVGFNNIRFDDEFIRFLNYRNFHDAYEWHWADKRSRWDMLDVVRMTRALRPEGIKWPVGSDGSPSNRLEDVASINKLVHDKAHDALSDVQATIALANLIHSKQPKLFNHLLNFRDKKLISELVNSGQPFAYTSGKYPSEFLHTTAVAVLGENPNKQGVVVYDLRYDPTEILKLSDSELLERWQHYCQLRPCPHPRVPLKTLQFNRCPAVAPLGVIDTASAKRISLDHAQVETNFSTLKKVRDELYEKVLKILSHLNQKQADMFSGEQLSESALYDGFIPEQDKKLSAKLTSSPPEGLPTFMGKFKDPRLNSLLPLYISKNFPKAQTDDIRAHYEKYKQHKLFEGGEKSKLAVYLKQLEEKISLPETNNEQKYLLEELKLWAQALVPEI